MTRPAASTNLQISTMTPTKTNDLIKFALKLLSVRDYFSCEIAQKLEKKDAEKPDIDLVVQYLNKYKYLNDSETLRKYADEVFRKNRGINYLKKKLYEKGCKTLFSDAVFSKVYTKEMERNAAKKLAESMPGHPVEKIVGRLKSRGFSTDVIYEVYEGLKQT